jgi:putative transposase
MDSESTLTKSRKIRIYPNKQQTTIFKQWFGVSRKFYNQTVDFLNNKEKTDKTSWMQEANLLAHSLTESYVKAVPYQIKRIAVKDAFASFFTNAKKAKEKKITHFKLKFRNKHKVKQSCYIPKSALSEKGIYHSIAGKLKISELGWLNDEQIKDGRLVLESGRWFIIVPVEVKQKQYVIENQNDIVAIDPGIRSFGTFFSKNGYFGQVGHGDFGKLFSLCLSLDRLYSARSKRNKPDRKQRGALKRKINKKKWRIKNLREELHNKFIHFLVSNFGVIVYPPFHVSEMVLCGKRKLSRRSVRNFLNWGFYDFEEKLIGACAHRGIVLIRESEAYTSKTNSFTGEMMNIGSREWFTHEGIRVNRDINGARNILVRAMRDSSACA